ncbi:hypothetical protein GCM10009601_16590 [Streptomyces thermospinosisporus]|uniref:Integral membrane protein n=1 Tax=Streptomyces thermospinosisporus TaxID=161482 RepID=A0ABP4JHF8_9ACTN
MAHAAPRPRTTGRRPTGTPDLFSERTHAMARIGTAVVLGLIFGFWAAANARYGGPVTGWNLLLGFVSAAAFIVVYLALLAIGPRLPRELHAAAWGAFTGCAVGFLVSQSHASILRSTWLGLISGAGLGLLLFYVYYSREDARGGRASREVARGGLASREVAGSSAEIAQGSREEAPGPHPSRG